MQSLRIIFLLLIALFAHGAWADPGDAPLESQVKAAFIYKFMSFVEWPDAGGDPAEPFTIGVVDADDLARDLTKVVTGRKVGGRSIQVRQIDAADPPGGVRVLFVGRSVGARLPKLLAALRSKPVLVISEQDGALSAGSVINFVVIDEQVRFQISLPSAEQARLKISSRLLGVAQQVITGEQ